VERVKREKPGSCNEAGIRLRRLSVAHLQKVRRLLRFFDSFSLILSEIYISSFRREIRHFVPQQNVTQIIKFGTLTQNFFLKKIYLFIL